MESTKMGTKKYRQQLMAGRILGFQSVLGMNMANVHEATPSCSGKTHDSLGVAARFLKRGSQYLSSIFVDSFS